MSEITVKCPPGACVQIADSEQEVRHCWPLFRELRPHLSSEQEFFDRWTKQRTEGYMLAYLQLDGAIVAAAGFRTMNTLAWGKIIYLDDLIALSTMQGRGFGSVLLAWLQEQARELKCDAVHLDTGYQRHAAHKAYLRNGFQLNCHHLAWQTR